MTTENEQILETESPAVIATEVKEESKQEVRNPDKLLELYTNQKNELKELKAFKAEQDKLKAKIEEDKLLEKQNYEKLIPLKIDEAVKPYQSQLNDLETTKSTLEAKLLESENRFKELEDRQLRSTHRAKVVSSFSSVDGIADDSTIDYLLSAHGDKFQLDSKGELPDLSKFYDDFKKTAIGSALFKAKIGSGSETSPQGSKTPKIEPSTGIRVVSSLELMSPRKNGFTMEDVRTGKVVVK